MRLIPAENKQVRFPGPTVSMKTCHSTIINHNYGSFAFIIYGVSQELTSQRDRQPKLSQFSLSNSKRRWRDFCVICNNRRNLIIMLSFTSVTTVRGEMKGKVSKWCVLKFYSSVIPLEIKGRPQMNQKL